MSTPYNNFNFTFPNTDNRLTIAVSDQKLKIVNFLVQ